MMEPVQKEKRGSDGTPGKFPAGAPLAETKGYEYYVAFMLKERTGGQTAYYAVRLSQGDAAAIRELDRRLADPDYDLHEVRGERTRFLTERARDFTAFVAGSGRYDFGFLPAADAQTLVMRI